VYLIDSKGFHPIALQIPIIIPINSRNAITAKMAIQWGYVWKKLSTVASVEIDILIPSTNKSVRPYSSVTTIDIGTNPDMDSAMAVNVANPESPGRVQFMAVSFSTMRTEQGEESPLTKETVTKEVARKFDPIIVTMEFGVATVGTTPVIIGHSVSFTASKHTLSAAFGIHLTEPP